jgi:hypothetical protein
VATISTLTVCLVTLGLFASLGGCVRQSSGTITAAKREFRKTEIAAKLVERVNNSSLTPEDKASAAAAIESTPTDRDDTSQNRAFLDKLIQELKSRGVDQILLSEVAFASAKLLAEITADVRTGGKDALAEADDPEFLFVLEYLQLSGVSEKLILQSLINNLGPETLDTPDKLKSVMNTPALSNFGPAAKASVFQDKLVAAAARNDQPVLSSPGETIAAPDTSTPYTAGPIFVSLATATDTESQILGQGLSYVIVSSPVSGQLGSFPFNAVVGGDVAYTPRSTEPHAAYTDTFSYKICDAVTPPACTASIIVTVNVPEVGTPIVPVNLMPGIAVAGDTSKSTPQNTPVAIALSTGSDPGTSSIGQSLGYLASTLPSNGTLSAWAANAAFGGTVTYTPNNGYLGSDSFSYQICNNESTPLCSEATTVALTILDSSAASAPTLGIAAGGDNIINIAENTAPGALVTITGEAGASYTLTCTTNCTVTAGATGTLNGGGTATATIQATASGAVAISATQTDTSGNTSLAGTASTTADIVAPVFTSLALANGAADNTLNTADVSANLAVATLSASGQTSAHYALVSPATTCDGSVTYSKSSLPTAGDTEFVDGSSYKLCVRLTDDATNTAYGAASGNIAVNTSAPSISYAGATGTSGVVGTSMSVTPTTLDGNGNSITNCTSSPSLTSGLTINSTTCVVSGTPTAAITATTYTITATTNTGANSATVSISVLYFPTAYALSAQSGLDSQVALAWQAPTGVAQSVTAYKVYRSVSSGFTPGAGTLITTTTAAATSYTDTGRTNGTRYYYKVVAVYSSYEAAPSVEASAVPQDPASTIQDLTNIYVAPTGSDTTGNGSIGNPYLTIGTALTNVAVGGTIYLKDGFYTALPTLSKAVTLQSMTGDYRTSSAVISQSGSLTPGSIISGTLPASNVIFRGIETINVNFSGPTEARTGLGFFNCYFHSISGNWLHASGSANYTNITIYGNYIRSVGDGTRTDLSSFINYWPTNGHTNANWTVSHNTIEGTSYGGFQLKGVTGLTIRHNTFSGSCDNAIHLWGLFDKTGTVEVAYNLFGSSFQAGGHAACTGSAILIDNATSYGSSHEIKIQNNVFTRNDNAILIDLGTVDLTGKPLSIYNNSFETSNTKAIYLKSATGTLDVRNNFWGHSSGPTYSGNAGGLGAAFNIASGLVSFSPFLTSEPTPPQTVLRGQNETGGSGASLSSVISNSLVLFQADLTQNSADRGAGTSIQGVKTPNGIGAFRDVNAGGGMKFFVADRANNRVLIFNSVPYSTSDVPDVVVGQSDFSENGLNAGGGTVSENGFAVPIHVTVCANGKMFVTDRTNHRVLGYNRVPTNSGTAADFVIGQANFSGSSSGTSATTLNSPYSVHCNDNRLFVVDGGNRRVVVYYPIPSANQPSASYVIGQPDLNTGTSGCAANKLNLPTEALFLDGKVFVTDNNNSRVLAFPDTGTTNPTAQLVLGQADFTSCSVNAGGGTPSAGSMHAPYSLAFDGKNTLAVSDGFNHRVLLFTAPFTNGEAATSQIGQDDFTSSTLYATPNITNRLKFPKRLIFDNGYLWIADGDNNRVVAFPRP